MELRKLKVPAIVISVLVTLAVLAWLGTAPWKLSEGEEPIEPKTRWIDVPGEPFEFSGYVEEGGAWNQSFDFSEPYVSEVTVFLTWEDDARTESDTLQFLLVDGNDTQKAAGSSYNQQVSQRAVLSNTEHVHVVNSDGWEITVNCLLAGDGYIFPGGLFKIDDTGNDFTVRFEWRYFKEYNPEWE